MRIYFDISFLLHIFADDLSILCKGTKKKPINSKFYEI